MSEQMKTRKKFRFVDYPSQILLVWVILLLLLMGRDSPLYNQVYAQGDTCDPIIADQVEIVNSTCSELNSNWACYGHNAAVAAPDGLRFSKEGDQQPIEILQTITTTYPSGVAVLRLHVDGEDASVNVILLGAQLEPGGANIFTIRNENGKELCSKTPPGMLIRTDTGKRSRITVNGVEIALGSSAYITMQTKTQMTIANLEGNVTVLLPGLNVGRQPSPGQQVGVTLNNGTPVTVTVPVSSAMATSTLLQWLATDENGLRKVVDPNTEVVPNVPACHGTIAYGQTVTAKNSTPSQECLYTFNGKVGDIVAIQMATTTGKLNPWVDLRGPDGQLISFNNNEAANNTNSQLCNPGLPVSGTYTIVARADQNASVGSFKLTLSKKSACPSPPRVVVTCRKVQLGGWIVYNVQPGDTLSGIAQRNRANISQLMQVNCLTSSVIKIGEPLFVPLPPCAKVQPRGWVAYRVRAGDTLSGLAQSRRTSINQLMQVNCLASTVIKTGESLFVPPLPPTATPTPTIKPTITVTPTTVTPCPGLELISLSIDPTRRAVVFDWEAAGGCEPINGNLSVTFIGSDGEKTETVGQTDTSINGLLGFLTVQQPTSALCSLEAVYLFDLYDSRGQHATTRGRQPLRNTCDGEAVTDVPTDIPTDLPKVTDTVTLVASTPVPIDTPTPPNTPVTPTDVPIPTDTVAAPIDTPVPPTDIPIPTDTVAPATDTPVPPTDTPAAGSQAP